MGPKLSEERPPFSKLINLNVDIQQYESDEGTSSKNNISLMTTSNTTETNNSFPCQVQPNDITQNLDKDENSKVLSKLCFKTGMLLRTGATQIIGSVSEEETDKKESEIVFQSRSRNVAKRSKPFRKVNKLINFQSLQKREESFNELVSDRNFCRFIINDENLSIAAKLFAEVRLKYINDKLSTYV